MSISHTKSQVSIEFIIMFFIFLLFTSSIMMMYIVKNEEIKERRVYLETQSVLTEIVMTINTAIVRGDGFSIELEIPDYIFNSDYSVVFNQSWVYIIVPNYNITLFRSTFSEAVSGNFEKGKNVIKNIGGELFVV
jgi:hypothetical protein